MLNLVAPALRDAGPRRPQADPSARPAGRGRRDRPRQRLPVARTGCRSRSTPSGARFGEPEQAGMIFVDGVDIGDPADVALRDRRMLSADGIFIVVATDLRADRRVGRRRRGDLPRRAVHRAGRRPVARRSAPRSSARCARRAAGGHHEASTCSRRSCTTTSRRSSTTGCGAGRWCCRSSSRSERGSAPPAWQVQVGRIVGRRVET